MPVIEIKKEASHFVFRSLTVLEKDHLKHWFSSLQPSRNAVFSIIEHFWRELLLSPSEAPLRVTKGKQLTGLMACSQKRLEETARVLHHQGEQLDSITKGLDKMESDLDVADRIFWKASCRKGLGCASRLGGGLCSHFLLAAHHAPCSGDQTEVGPSSTSCCS
ncbi:synaptosomal-associated protein 47-like [Callorhinus ursinus]|uniref:synaptosomal-associated protein 47-like n=1 Tax=Callorhinus ursinus TaxID=34884 RepID=UPI003CCFFBB4